MIVTPVFDFTELFAAMERARDYAENHSAKEAARLATPIIVKRTKSGNDATGAPFAPYTDRYKEIRKKRGRQESPVDLYMSGYMLDNTIPQDDTVMPPDAMAGAVRGHMYADGPYNRHKRVFLGITDKEAPVIGHAIAEKTRDAMLGK